jgi:putative SOS response-associated peptidase YedK
MPVLLRRDQIETWLAEDTPVDDLQAMLQPWPHELAVVQVDKAVGNVRHKDGAWMAGPWLEMPEDVSPT